MGNKVNFGLRNAHYAPFEMVDGEIVYGTPVKLPGSVELSLEPRGDMVEFYADNIVYYAAQNNQGYEGTLSIANLPEQFLIDALGENKDESDGVLTESSEGRGKPFALMFEFDGDVKATRHVLYNCTANRPTIGGQTKTETVEPEPNELTFIASPRETDSHVKTKTTTDTKTAIYETWYDSVYEKVEEE